MNSLSVAGVPAEVWFPVLTLVLGIVLKGANDLLGDARKNRADHEAREYARVNAAKLRRIEFQRETLIAFQDLIPRLGRECGKIHHHDVMASAAGAKWGRTLLNGDGGDAFRLACAEAHRLRVRLAEPEHRDLAQAFVDSGGRCVNSSSSDESYALLARTAELGEKLNEALGDKLRLLDHDEDKLS